MLLTIDKAPKRSIIVHFLWRI